MGTWGAGLFQDDTALDVRETYRDLIADGRPGAEAVRIVTSELGPDGDPEESCVFWLALAAVQWELGRLDDAVRDAALAVIQSGADLDRWRGSRLLARRRAVLNALEAKLRSPPPRLRTPRRRRASEVPSSDAGSPDGQAVASAFSLSPIDPAAVPTAQVVVTQVVGGSQGGSSVFVAQCGYDEIGLRWIGAMELEISYPSAAQVTQQRTEAFFSGRTITVRYSAIG